MARSCVRTKKLLVTDTPQLKRTKMEAANVEWNTRNKNGDTIVAT